MSFKGNEKKVEQIIKNDGFWPDLSIAEFQMQYRLPAEYYQKLIESILEQGIIWANTNLEKFKFDARKQGFENLNQLKSTCINGKTRNEILYKRAAYSYAKAISIKQFATTSTKDTLKNETKESQETEEKFIEFAEYAIEDFLGKSRHGVHLI